MYDEDFEGDALLDANSDLIGAWQDQIDDYRELFTDDNRTDLELAIEFQEEEREEVEIW